MRNIFLAIVMILALVAPVGASTPLTDRVNAAYGARSVSAEIEAMAAVRAQQISVNFCHCATPYGYSEVIAWNRGEADPIGKLVDQWIGSPPHNAILSNFGAASIGCATYVSGAATYGVCLLPWPGTQNSNAAAAQPLVVTPAPPAPAPAPTPTPVTILPNTAMDE